jgi:hypothetical protein
MPQKPLQRKAAHAKPSKHHALANASVQSRIVSHILKIRPNQKFILMIPAVSLISMYLGQRVFSSPSTSAISPTPTENNCEFDDRKLLETGENIQDCLKLIEKNIQSAKEIIRVSTALGEKISKTQSPMASVVQDEGEKIELTAYTAPSLQSNQSGESWFDVENGHVTANRKTEPQSIGSRLNQWLDGVMSQVWHILPIDDEGIHQTEPHKPEVNDTENNASPEINQDYSESHPDALNTTHHEASLCGRWKTQYQVVPGSNWGTLPKQEQEYWLILNCDCLLISKGCKTSAEQDLLNGSIPKSITLQGISDAVMHRPEDARLPCRLPKNKEWKAALCVSNSAPSSASPVRPIVAVLIPTSSRGQVWKQAAESHLLTRSLPSLLLYTEDGFEYRFYVGYDTDDSFYCREDVQLKITEWFRKELRWGQSAVLLPFANELHKPGPIFNFLSSSAAADGAEYLYRINDDTKTTAPFASAMVGALEHMMPPQLGVAGPECRQGNQQILTHDFVHKSHLAVFGLHYPPTLPDWWMDDWISIVYPPNNTARLSTATVEHHSAAPRYAVDQRNLRRLRIEVASARSVLREYVTTHWSSAFVSAHLSVFTDQPEWMGYGPDKTG